MEEIVTKIVIENDAYVYQIQHINCNLKKKKFTLNCVSNVATLVCFFILYRSYKNLRCKTKYTVTSGSELLLF